MGEERIRAFESVAENKIGALSSIVKDTESFIFEQQDVLQKEVKPSLPPAQNERTYYGASEAARQRKHL